MAISHHGQRFSPARELESVPLRRRSQYLVAPFGGGQLLVDTRTRRSGAPTTTNGHRDGRTAEKVQCRRLDGLVEDGLLDPGSVGLFWSDAQAHERRATTLAQAGVPHVVEFCPDLLGGDAPELEDHLTSRFTTIVDLRTGTPVSPAAMPDLRRRYQRRSYTDLLLIP